MRMDQFPGISPGAKKFLQENRRLPNVCKTCGQVIGGHYSAKIGTFPGMFGTDYPLYRYLLKDNKVAHEFLQIASWSSGPNHFLGLRLSDGTELIWSDKEIEEWL